MSKISCSLATERTLKSSDWLTSSFGLVVADFVFVPSGRVNLADVLAGFVALSLQVMFLLVLSGLVARAGLVLFALDFVLFCCGPCWSCRSCSCWVFLVLQVLFLLGFLVLQVCSCWFCGSCRSCSCWFCWSCRPCPCWSYRSCSGWSWCNPFFVLRWGKMARLKVWSLCLKIT